MQHGRATGAIADPCRHIGLLVAWGWDGFANHSVHQRTQCRQPALIISLVDASYALLMSREMNWVQGC
jgi:hypothetical protein